MTKLTLIRGLPGSDNVPDEVIQAMRERWEEVAA